MVVFSHLNRAAEFSIEAVGCLGTDSSDFCDRISRKARNWQLGTEGNLA